MRFFLQQYWINKTIIELQTSINSCSRSKQSSFVKNKFNEPFNFSNFSLSLLIRAFSYLSLSNTYSIYQFINCQTIFIHHIFNTNKLINLFFRPFKQFRTKPQNICRYLQYSLNLSALIIAPIPLTNSAVPFIATTARLF